MSPRSSGIVWILFILALPVAGFTLIPLFFTTKSEFKNQERQIKEILDTIQGKRINTLEEVSKSIGDTNQLFYAAIKGEEEKCRELLDGGVFIDSSDQKHGMTALHFSALAGQVDVCTLLIERGATIGRIDSEGETPLHKSAFSGKEEACRVLLSRGAQVRVAGKAGFTPLHYAAAYGHSTIVSLFLAKGARPSVADKRREMTPLHMAALGGYEETCKVLLENGANPLAVDAEGATPLHRAARRRLLPVCETLIAHGGSTTVEDNNGMTPLHHAVLDAAKGLSPDKICSLLIEKGAPINVADKKGATPLHYVAESGNSDVYQLLVSRGAREGEKNLDGKTPLELRTSLLLPQTSSHPAVALLDESKQATTDEVIQQ